MIIEIKELKKKKLFNDFNIKDVSELSEQLKIELQDLKTQENELSSKKGEIDKQRFDLMKPIIKWNWFQRHITQRKEYREYKETNKKLDDLMSKSEQIEKQINQLKDKIWYKEKQFNEMQAKLNEYKVECDKIEQCTTLKELGTDFFKAYQFLEKNNLPIVLTEEDKYITPQESEFTSLEELIAIHKTKWVPKGMKIQTAKEAGAVLEEKWEGYNISYKSPRDTIHAAVNGEVSEHFAGNNWDDYEYAVLKRVVDIPKEQIAEAPPMDLFTKGGWTLTPDSWITCPKDEIEEVKKNNPGINVIGYEGHPKGYAAALASALGYKHEGISNFYWSDLEDDEKYKKLVLEKGFTIKAHSYTEIGEEDKYMSKVGFISGLLDILQKENLSEKTRGKLLTDISIKLEEKPGTFYIKNSIVQYPEKLLERVGVPRKIFFRRC